MESRVLSSLLLASAALVSLRFELSSAAYDLEAPYPPLNSSDSRTPLYFSLIQSFSGQYISAYSLPGLQMALDFINEDETLLPGYSLHFIFTDAPVSRTILSFVHAFILYNNTISML